MISELFAAALVVSTGSVVESGSGVASADRIAAERLGDLVVEFKTAWTPAEIRATGARCRALGLKFRLDELFDRKSGEVKALYSSRLGEMLAAAREYADVYAGAGLFTVDGCFPGYLDRLGFTPGHLYCANKLEPSGTVVSALGSSVSAMMGMFAGDMLKYDGSSQMRKVHSLVVAGAVSGVLGWLVSLDCPIIKNLWTPSFSLVVGGYSFLMLALFYWIIDVKGWQRWCVFLEVVGLNSIAIYMLRRIVDYKAISRFLFGGVASWFPDPLFIESLGIFALCWLTCWLLHRHKIYLKV